MPESRVKIRYTLCSINVRPRGQVIAFGFVVDKTSYLRDVRAPLRLDARWQVPNPKPQTLTPPPKISEAKETAD